MCIFNRCQLDPREFSDSRVLLLLVCPTVLPVVDRKVTILEGSLSTHVNPKLVTFQEHSFMLNPTGKRAAMDSREAGLPGLQALERGARIGALGKRMRLPAASTLCSVGELHTKCELLACLPDRLHQSIRPEHESIHPFFHACSLAYQCTNCS